MSYDYVKLIQYAWVKFLYKILDMVGSILGIPPVSGTMQKIVTLYKFSTYDSWALMYLF